MVVWNDLSNTQWLEYDSQSNTLRRTYVNGFLDVSQNIVGRKDLELKGNMTINGREGYKWNAYGQVLSGNYETVYGGYDNDYVYFGKSTHMDALGTTIVVGAHDDDTGASENGAVYVYRYDTTAELWYQLGNTIGSPTAGSLSDFGEFVQISANGNRIAVLNGIVEDLYFYDYNSGSNRWVPAGSILKGEHGTTPILSFGGMQLSGDGNTILFSNRDRAVVYRNNTETTWTKIGEITASSSSSFYSFGLAISYNGNRIAFGEPSHDNASTGGTLSNAGRATIYDYDSDTNWTQVGDWIYSDIAEDYFGMSGNMTGDGSIVLLSSNRSAENIGSVSVYQYDANVNGSWKQLGSTITGSHYDSWGHGAKISDDGTTLVAGNEYYDATDTAQGALLRIQIHQWRLGTTRRYYCQNL